MVSAESRSYFYQFCSNFCYYNEIKINELNNYISERTNGKLTLMMKNKEGIQFRKKTRYYSELIIIFLCTL